MEVANAILVIMSCVIVVILIYIALYVRDIAEILINIDKINTWRTVE